MPEKKPGPQGDPGSPKDSDNVRSYRSIHRVGTGPWIVLIPL